uniref:Ig-like domain-containing protein n=1 Tax=Scophthalmus maximus TaxID=52904 RepID=A0A8D2ZSH5_SCOMX
YNWGKYANITHVYLHCHAVGVHASCPIELSPPSVVVRYGDPVSVNCSTSEIQHGGMGWEATQGGRSLEYNVQHLTWTVENLTDWPISPSCFLNMPNEQCSRKPKVVLYTFPENISIGSSSGPDGVMREGHEYNITCLVHNVAPVQHLTVTWYKGDSPISRDTFDNGSKKPTDQPSVYSLTPTRRDNGATFRCEAQMDLGPEGPRLNVSSAEHSVTVHCKYFVFLTESLSGGRKSHPLGQMDERWTADRPEHPPEPERHRAVRRRS